MQLDRPWIGCSGASPFSFAFRQIPASSVNPPITNSPHHPPRLPRRYSVIRATPTMGRMDCTRFNHFNNRIRCGDVRDEEDFSLTKSSEEEDCGEC